MSILFNYPPVKYERTSLNTLEWFTDCLETRNVKEPSSILCLTLSLNVITCSNPVLIHFQIPQWYLKHV